MQSGMEMMMSAAIKSLGLDPEEIKAKVESIGKMATDANTQFGVMQTNERLMIEILQGIVISQGQIKDALVTITDLLKNQTQGMIPHGDDGGNTPGRLN